MGDLESKTGTELKELCVSKGLKAAVASADCVERLLEAAKASGEIDEKLAVLNQDARRKELMNMHMDSLLKLCKETATDPLVKEVMVERLLAHEGESGRIKLDDEHKSKKARVSMKRA